MMKDKSKKIRKFLTAFLIMIGAFWIYPIGHYLVAGIMSHDSFMILLLVYLIVNGIWLFYAITDMIFHSSTYADGDVSDMLKIIALLVCNFFAYFYILQLSMMLLSLYIIK